MLDVLFLTYNDWANTGWKFIQCARRLGLKCMGFKGNYHPYFYPEQTPIHPSMQDAVRMHEHAPMFKNHELKPFAENAQIIHYTSSHFIDVGLTDYFSKNIVFQHSGREYRVWHEPINELYNQIANATIIQMPDLLGLGAKNEHLIYFPVDTDFIKPNFDRIDSKKIVVGHFPSQPELKGTADIIEMIKDICREKAVADRLAWHGGFDLEEYKRIFAYYDNLAMISECDIFLDTCAEIAYGKPYGEWGNTAFEAAAMGKIVITNSLNFHHYEREYGDCELIIANTISELREKLLDVLSWPDEKIYRKKRASRMWVQSNHSFDATAHRLWKKVYRGLL